MNEIDAKLKYPNCIIASIVRWIKILYNIQYCIFSNLIDVINFIISIPLKIIPIAITDGTNPT